MLSALPALRIDIVPAATIHAPGATASGRIFVDASRRLNCERIDAQLVGVIERKREERVAQRPAAMLAAPSPPPSAVGRARSASSPFASSCAVAAAAQSIAATSQLHAKKIVYRVHRKFYEQRVTLWSKGESVSFNIFSFYRQKHFS